MGSTYHYTNLTKREWFSIDALGGDAKLRGLGLGRAARAFELLLVNDDPLAGQGVPVRIGRWAGDSIAIVGDFDPNWLIYLEGFADLTADVIVMLHAQDGFERIGAAAADDTELFMQLCHLIVTRQALQLEGSMKSQFGASFRQRYKELCAERLGFKPRDIAHPRSGGSQ